MEEAGAKVVIAIADARAMGEVADASVSLVVTSPPYWHIKDYGSSGQIGYGQSLHEYLGSLLLVWRECHRALSPGGRLCVNVGDQFARASVYGRYRVIPLHAEIIRQCELAGFDFMGSIIWQKKTTVNTSGGAVVMGSYPFPPNGIVELDYEFILLLKKPGRPRKAPPELKQASAMTKEEWKSYFSGHWSFGGARKAAGHEAPYPVELPRRLIRMFSFVGDTVLDPFLGTGTTAVAALELGRSCVGYEINEAYAEAARLRLAEGGGGLFGSPVEVRPAAPRPVPLAPEAGTRRGITAPGRLTPPAVVKDYQPGIPDALPQANGAPGPAREVRKVVSILPGFMLELETGTRVRFLGLRIRETEAASSYLRGRILHEKVFLKHEVAGPGGEISAYVYLKNRIFVNAHLVKTGMAEPDGSEHRLRVKFETLAAGRGA